VKKATSNSKVVFSLFFGLKPLICVYKILYIVGQIFLSDGGKRRIRAQWPHLRVSLSCSLVFLRCRQRLSVEQRAPAVRTWYMDMLNLFKSKCRNSEIDGERRDAAWGRFLPHERLNMDQSPLAFCGGHKDTYESINADTVWVSQPSEGLMKRAASLHLTI
jgi:hypothetical protein